jgi:tRNA dimethylallyltransferase
MSLPFFVIISGPTGVGKTAFVEELSGHLSLPCEIINADVGQFYTPLSVGTAKPDVLSQKVPHHLFNILDTPLDYTVTQFRYITKNLIEEITNRGALPIIVGGSGFYLASLFYPPCEVARIEGETPEWSEFSTEELWRKLHDIDPVRAEKLHKNDRYRLERALHLWYTSGVQPSLCEPAFEPLGQCAFFFLTADLDTLSHRIAERVHSMFEAGWLEEVKQVSPEWHTFLETKKLIGYAEIVKYLKEQQAGARTGELYEGAFEQLEERIALKTRSYAKRQITFWKGLKKRLQHSDPTGTYLRALEELDSNELNLTLSSYDLYLKQFSSRLNTLYGSTLVNRSTT